MAMSTRYYIALILWVLGISVAYSQEVRTEMYVNFRVNSSVVDTTYLDNAARMREIVSYLEAINEDPSVRLLEVSFCGAASPEGSAQINSKLARMRLSALEDLIRDEIYIPDHLVTYNYGYIPWDYLREQVVKSNLRYKDDIIRILDEESRMVAHHLPGHRVDQRVLKLKQLRGGEAWLELYQLFFAQMRNAYVVFVTTRDYSGVDDNESYSDNAVLIPESIDNLVRFKPTHNHIGGPKFYLKTNLIGWSLGMVNIAPEIDFLPHWSLNLPLYYSAWNYFKTTVKFRTLNFQPEVRYWVDESNSGFFAGAHLGVASYNFAFDGEYRFQDRDGVTPAFGGGVSLGYRIPISRNGHWQMEFTLGAGAYALNFDVFKNTPDTKDGELVQTHRMTHVGLDQAAVSFSYAFDLKKKGGRR